ncbi:MAG TPA: DNA repair protein RadC [Gemmatimonadota bacterium]|nr:DNA repair protein RadC [Gemmatimonadota bacterium]
MTGERILSIKDWPEQERPRERLENLGPTALSTVELLTLLIGSGSRGCPADELARRILASYPNLRVLAARPAGELARVAGVGTATAARLAAACELGRRLQRERRERQPVLGSPRAVWRHLALELRDRERERFLLLCLNTRNELVRELVVSVGSLSASIVHPREVFKPALACAAASLIIAHNHPSGDPTPSREDREVTRVLSEAGRLLDVPLHDHVIIGADSYYSFRDAGLL